jgi:hypothetical protein
MRRRIKELLLYESWEDQQLKTNLSFGEINSYLPRERLFPGVQMLSGDPAKRGNLHPGVGFEITFGAKGRAKPARGRQIPQKRHFPVERFDAAAAQSRERSGPLLPSPRVLGSGDPVKSFSDRALIWNM